MEQRIQHAEGINMDKIDKYNKDVDSYNAKTQRGFKLTAVGGILLLTAYAIQCSFELGASIP